MSRMPRPEVSSRTPAGHLSVHLGEQSNTSVPLEPGRNRIPVAVLVSLLGHVAAIVVILAGLHAGVTPAQTNNGRSQIPPGIVWLAPAIGGAEDHGGGGGGDHTSMPPRRVELPGRDALSVPVAHPTPLLAPAVAIPNDNVPPIAQLDISALKTAAGLETVPGSIDGIPEIGSRGPGDGSGAGRGSGSGDGPGRGPGYGDGTGGNRGGGVVQRGMPGVRDPRVLREVRPLYTAEAMQAKIEGTAVIECVVLPDGTVGDVEVVKSVDPRFGLDREAVKAASRWLFQPATLKGQPVAMRIQIHLTFTLR